MSTALHDICMWLFINAVAQPFVIWLAVGTAMVGIRTAHPVLSGVRASEFANHPLVSVEDGAVRYLAGNSHPLPWKFALTRCLFWPGWLLMFSLSGLVRQSGGPLLFSIIVGLHAGLLIVLPAALFLNSRQSSWLHAHLATLPPGAKPDHEVQHASIIPVAPVG